MKYHFRAGRGKNIIISDTQTFEDLGFAILREYNIFPDHLFMFVFANGEETSSCSPFGPINDYNDVDIDMPIKNRNLEVGETMTFIYDYSTDWSRKVKLIEIIDESKETAGEIEKKTVAGEGKKTTTGSGKKATAGAAKKATTAGAAKKTTARAGKKTTDQETK